MAVDPVTGMWDYQTRPMPGPGNSDFLGAMLGVMNILRGGELSRQGDAQRRKQEMEAISRAASEGTGIFDTPEGMAGAREFNISPESMERLKVTPETIARQELAQLPPGATVEDQLEIYQRTGAKIPPGLYGYGSAKTRAQVQAENEKKRAYSKIVSDASRIYTTAARSGATEEQALQAAARFISSFVSDEDTRNQLTLQAAEQAQMASGEALPIPKARVGALEAQTGERRARTEQIQTMTPVLKKLAESRARLADASAALAGRSPGRGLGGAGTLGGLTPPQILAREKFITWIDDEITELVSLIPLSEAERAAIGTQMEGLVAAKKRTKEELASAPKAGERGAAAPTTGAGSFKPPAGSVQGKDKRTGKTVWKLPNGKFVDEAGNPVQ